jgi:glucose-1-phosphate adenylyltransferase
LNDYIGNGQPWGLDKSRGGVHVLPPYETSGGKSWFDGTANAIYQNINFIERYNPEYVVVLGGDHIYKLDYSKMLEFHKENDADCTIAVLNVSMEEATRFGIMICDPNEPNRIIDFEEKPAHPRSTLASMGIYIFTWEKLRKYLIKNEEEANAKRDAGESWSKDFGKDIIPMMREDNQRLFAYNFEGYWKDVGTLDSLWDANMDIIDPNVPLDLYEESWKIYSRNPIMPPQYQGENAVVENSVVSEGSDIDGSVDFSVIFAGVTIEKGATVNYSVIMPGAVIKSGATVEYSIVGENTIVESNAHVGAKPEAMSDRDDWGIAVIGHNQVIAENQVVAPKEMVPDIRKK